MAPVIDVISQSLSRMSRREQLLVLGLAGALVVLVVAIVSYLIIDGLDTRHTRNAQIREVTERLVKNRGRLTAGKSEDALLDLKLDRPPPALQSHIEGIAKRLEVEVKDYRPAEPKELGPQKRVLERSVTISLYDITLDKLAKFLEAIESGGYVIMVTELNMTPRSTDHGRIDVNRLQVSAYERNEKPVKKPEKGKEARTPRSRP